MRLLLALAAACLLAAPAHGLDGRRLHVDAGRLVDRAHREITLRGVNARVDGIFDVTFSDGRLPLEPIPTFDDGDADRMRDLGFNLLRLPVNWSALEPTRGRYDPLYLRRIAAVVDRCAARGIVVLLDLHQDAFSKEIGQDGAPRWVLDLLLGPGGYPLLGGPLTDLGARRFAPYTLDAFKRFFENQDGVQDAFARAVVILARRFRNHRGVVGYETFNEPIAFRNPDGTNKLIAFHTRVATAIRRVDRRHLIAFEPDALRNVVNQAPLPAAPLPVEGTVYAPHVYTDVFDGGDFSDGDPGPLTASMERAAAEAAAWGAPLLVGEYGIDPALPTANLWITTHLDVQDRLRAHSTFWLWEEISEGHWGLYDGESDVPGGERVARTTALSRTYARAVPGTVLEHAFDAAANTLRLRYRAHGRRPLELFLPPRRYPHGASVRCDGAARPATPDAHGVLTLRCGSDGGEHVVEVTP